MALFSRKGKEKKKDSGPRSSHGVAPGVATPRREGNHWENEWQHPPPEPGMPGICGYLNGIKGHPNKHPERFVYVRPDGRPDDAPTERDVTPAVASTRKVPRGFFG